MLYKDENGNYRKPKEIFPEVTDIIKNYKFWSKRRMKYLGDDKFFDQEIRTGVCFFCNKEGRENKSETTLLHHTKYDHSDPLAWTIEVCTKCHWQIDEHNRKVITRKTGKEIKPRYQPYYENKEQRRTKAEREKEFWFLRYCSNLGPGNYVPIKRLIPDQETYDKIVEAIKNAAHKKAFPKGESMSDVSRKYF